KKIRDVQRLLAKEDLPADVRIEQERKLASLQHEKQVTARQQQEDKMQQKYKMVKFFEERKAVRRLKQAKKKLKAALNNTQLSPDEQEAERVRWSEEVRKVTVDLSYIENYPATEKYISLYKEEASGTDTGERRAELWKLAEQGL
ncbi:rRNA-processing protein EFG1, partial [Protomyces lactucae-debilis]